MQFDAVGVHQRNLGTGEEALQNQKQHHANDNENEVHAAYLRFGLFLPVIGIGGGDSSTTRCPCATGSGSRSPD